jgi:AbrB family looped-hinge helix DNA binding protein
MTSFGVATMRRIDDLPHWLYHGLRCGVSRRRGEQMRATVSINAQGRMTVPSEIRRELGITGEATVIVETEGGRMIMRPAIVIPAEDAWAFTAEHQERLASARADVAAGRVERLSESELRRRMDVDDE